MKKKRYQCLIVDDEKLARELIATHLEQLDQFELIASCSSAIEASQYLNQQTIDLMFLDIEMPVLNGTDFYKSLSYKPKVIFTTAYRDYALDGFDLNAVDYLLKPIVFSRFFKAIEKYLNTVEPKAITSANSNQSENDYLFIRSERKNVKVNFSEIVYIQSLKDYIKIFTRKKNYVVKNTITAFSKKLPNNFIRTHRSYIINNEHITAMTKHDIELDDIEIPIGDKYRDIVDKILSKT